MKVNFSQNIQQQTISRNNAKPQKQQNNNNVAFKGAGVTAFLDYLATNPVWGATATDVGFMGTPTTGMEIWRRGWGYGFEAGFREYTSTLNDASVGLYGLGAGTLIAGALTKQGISSPQRIFASNESVDVHSAKWKANGGNVESYINDCDKFDLIISNASLQWIENLPELVRKLYLKLNKNGTLLFTTFGKENFREIFFVMGKTLPYYTLEEFQTKFSDLSPILEEEVRIMAFKTPIDVLRHIKNTGVNAISSESWTKKDLENFEKGYNNFCTNHPTLTYNPIYVKLQK